MFEFNEILLASILDFSYDFDRNWDHFVSSVADSYAI